jgi:hypothetical protein
MDNEQEVEFDKTSYLTKWINSFITDLIFVLLNSFLVEGGVKDVFMPMMLLVYSREYIAKYSAKLGHITAWFKSKRYRHFFNASRTLPIGDDCLVGKSLNRVLYIFGYLNE